MFDWVLTASLKLTNRLIYQSKQFQLYSQPAFTCSSSTTGTLVQCARVVEIYQYEQQNEIIGVIFIVSFEKMSCIILVFPLLLLDFEQVNTEWVIIIFFTKYKQKMFLLSLFLKHWKFYYRFAKMQTIKES